MHRTYSEMVRLNTFVERYEYLRLNAAVAEATFGYDRYINQTFYRSREWRQMRDFIITRDNGCDLGVEGYEIFGQITIHHIRPMTIEDIQEGRADILDPDNLISVTHETHNAIHYGDVSLLATPFTERRPGDTKLW
jgi:hypothetical protein